MVTPTKYRSIYTGQEIDQAIASMRGAISADLIVNDLVTGGVDKVASAELAKILKTQLDSYTAPAEIKTRLLSVPNTKLLTDAELSRLTYLARTTSFRGSYPNAAARDAALVSESVGYVGGELAFLEDDGSGDGLQELSRWDTATNSWKKVKLYNEGSSTPVLVAAASTVDMFQYTTPKYNAIKVLILGTAVGGTQKQVQEVLVTHVGTDTYISVYNEIGNASNLFNLTSNIGTGVVNVAVQTLVANVTLSGKIIAII